MLAGQATESFEMLNKQSFEFSAKRCVMLFSFNVDPGAVLALFLCPLLRLSL
jgi:hypothetical protein